jgi:hypothetical protein
MSCYFNFLNILPVETFIDVFWANCDFAVKNVNGFFDHNPGAPAAFKTLDPVSAWPVVAPPWLDRVLTVLLH